MADQRVNINIGSSYNGSGMNSALGSIDKLSKTAGRASSAVGSLGGALGGIGGKAGQAIGAVTKLTSALAMGGPIGLAVAGVTALVGAFNDYTEKQEAAKKAAEEHAKKLKKLQEEAAKKAWKDFVDDLAKGRTEANQMATALEKVVSLENALATAKRNNVAATQSLAEAELNASTAANVRGAATPEDKAIAQAQGNISMAQLRGKANIDSAQSSATSIKSTITSVEQTYNAMIDIHDALERKVSELEEDWKTKHADDISLAQTSQAMQDRYNPHDPSSWAATDAEIIKELMAEDVVLQKSLKAIYEEEEKVQLRIRDEGLKLAALREQQEAAETNITRAKVQAAADEAAAQEALRQANEAKIKAENDAAGKRLEEEEKILQAKHEQELAETEILSKEEEIRRKTEIAAFKAEKIKQLDEEIIQTKEQLKNAIAKAKNAYDAAAAIANGGVWNPNNAPIGGRAGGRRGAAANNVDNQPWQDFAKPEGWDQRWAQTHPEQAAALGIEAGLSKKEQKEYNRLAGKAASNPENMQDSEWNKLHELAAKDPERKAAKAQEEADKKAKELENKQQAKEQLQTQAYTDIAEIKQRLEELGLK